MCDIVYYNKKKLKLYNKSHVTTIHINEKDSKLIPSLSIRDIVSRHYKEQNDALGLKGEGQDTVCTTLPSV